MKTHSAPAQCFERVRPVVLLAALLTLFALAFSFGPASALAAPPAFLWQSGEAGSAAGQTEIPRGVAAAPGGAPNKGHVFVADTLQHNLRVDEFSAWGKFIKTWGWDVVESGPGNTGTAFEICAPANGDTCKSGVEGTGNGQFGGFGPQGLAVDSAGNIYVVDQSNRRVQKFDPEGHFVSMFGGKVNKTKEEAAAPEAEQNLCPVDPGDVCQAGVEFCPGEESVADCQAGVQGPGKGQFGAWKIGDFIEIDPVDKVYVGDRERIQRFNTDGEWQGEISLSGETVQALTTDSSGNLYYTRSSGGGAGTKDDVFKIAPDGTPLLTFPISAPKALAVDLDGNLYVVSGESNPVIRKFSPSGSELESWGREEPPSPAPSTSTGLAFNFCAGSDKPGNIFLTNASATKAFVRAYGTGPVGCEPPPPRPPEIQAQYALSVDPDGALLQAQINPEFFPDATYFLEYGTGDCASGGCAARVPLSDLLLTDKITNAGIRTAAISLTGLAPGTTYHYRFVAESTGGGPEFGLRPAGEAGLPGEATFAAGLEGTIITPLPLAPKADCSNQELRGGASAFLPDCRAYEMVSPVDKNGFGIETGIVGTNTLAHASLDQSTGDGGGFAYSSKQAFGDTVGSPYSSQYLAHRAPGSGWSSDSISPPQEGFSNAGGGSERVEFDAEFKFFSEDLSEAWLFHNAEPTLAPCAPQNSPVLYQRDNTTDAYEALHCEPNAKTNPWHSIDLEGISADGCQAVFRSTAKLTEDAEPPGIYQLYEYDCEAGPPDKSGEGGLRLVSVLPESEGNCKKDATVGSPSGLFRDSEGRLNNVWHAFSENAGRLYWTCGDTLYLRSDPDLSEEGDENVVLVSPQELGIPLPTFFQTVAPDGSRALLRADQQLWSYEAGTESLNKVADGLPITTALSGASEDATRAYFTSTEALTATPNNVGDVAEKGQPNLYLHEEGSGFAFVGGLSGADVSGGARKLSPAHFLPYRRAARATPDGLHLAFISTAPLTGYDNTDQVSGEADAEVFLYDAEEGKLRCISCNPGGARPKGRNATDEVGDSRFWAAAWIPGWTTQLYPGRPLSPDGSRLFFNSIDALVPRDTNGRMDVYQWERASSREGCEDLGAELHVPSAGGCLSLISTGQDGLDSEFVDADADGSDVFIRTNESLVGSDPGLLDIYDARINGGFPEPTPPEPECEGEACQSPPAPPDFGTPASSSFQGPGNPQVTPPRRSCPKGKRKVRRQGKVRCVKKQHRKAAHRRAAR